MQGISSDLTEKQRERTRLAIDVAAYLRRGGRIEQLDLRTGSYRANGDTGRIRAPAADDGYAMQVGLAADATALVD